MSTDQPHSSTEQDTGLLPRAQLLAENLQAVLQRISSVAHSPNSVRLVAVSKLKPATDVLAIHERTGHTHFGENYSHELLEKAASLPTALNWHFIGALQTNKCKHLAERIPNLWAVESVDTVKKADALEKGRAALLSTSPSTPKLRVYVQVNTSGEESKSGCQPTAAPVLAKHILEECKHLTLQGLMTIGAIARSRESDIPNEDFLTLKRVRDEVAQRVGIDSDQLELSMGMSEDFEQAVSLGTSNVRVGTIIFGQRPLKKDAAI
ncbi:unnamed protein product [Tuber melanosporum]|uniref:Pyridoxal phosphate homeostasis protein n=1 Tax=Tuber melanosporum (strain Mel28) TaxID=656061 RepID=D5G6B1_TUBMM|nr:uncharacterized protein GSTUM_00004399001 [Tuber melanosporum]CAZ80054.1 unnamed protein product [Tuber melanosporum]